MCARLISKVWNWSAYSVSEECRRNKRTKTKNVKKKTTKSVKVQKKNKWIWKRVIMIKVKLRE